MPTYWWTRFGSLAIDSAVDEALTGNATIEGAQAALRQSEDEMRAGAGVFFPQVDAGFSASQVVLSAFAQVADTLRALENDAHALDAQTRARGAVAEALRLVKAEYVAGTVGYVQILIADSQFHQARIAWLQGVAQRLQDSVA
ncbi:outer membrane protein TolC [Paraburkholderia sp. WC7.3d]